MKRGRPKRHGTNRLSYAARAREEHGYRPDRMGRVGKACAWCNSALLSSSLLGTRHNAEVILSLRFVLYRNAGEHKRNISTAYNSFTTKGQTLLRHAQRTIMYCAKGPCYVCRPPHTAEHRLRNTSRSQQRDNSPMAWHFLLNGCRRCITLALIFGCVSLDRGSRLLRPYRGFQLRIWNGHQSTT